MARLTAPVLAALSLLLPGPAGAAKVPAETRFELWNDCRPVDLVVDSATRGTAELSLTERAIASPVRGKLAAAGIYDAEGLAYLDIHASVVGRAFHFSVEFRKWLKDPVSGEEGSAATWISGSTGTHGGNSDYVLASISEHVDRFIDQYLQVNADACNR